MALTDELRADFPALSFKARGLTPIYFDNAATALKPRAVIDTIRDFLAHNGTNVHRGIHYLSEAASEQFETAREVVAGFVGADKDELVFVRNTTEAVNMVAMSLPSGSRIVLTGMEHHSNVLPWRVRHKATRVPLGDDGAVDEEKLLASITDDVDLVAICHVSNVLGCVSPLERVIAKARQHDVQVLVDGAQAVPHLPVNVHALDCDYYAFSGHKLGGPTGIGGLYVKRERFSELEPLLWGGNMITEVHLEGMVLQEPPLRYEAGTPAIEGALGLAAACDYLDDIGRENIVKHSRELVHCAREGLARIPRAHLYGPSDPDRTLSMVSFAIEGMPANMVAKVLSDRENICIRSGWLCNQPLHEAMGLEPTARASFYLYNTVEEIEKMLSILESLATTA